MENTENTKDRYNAWINQFIMTEKGPLTNNEMRVRDLIALCHISDFETFQSDLQNYLSERNQVSEVQRLTDASLGKRTVFNRSAEKFYQSHKEVMDTIGTYTSFFDFINYNFFYDGSLRENSSLPYFVSYLQVNKDSMDTIIDTLTAIQELGIDRLKLNPMADFTAENLSLPTERSFSDRISYVDKTQYIPNYSGNFVYTAKDSPYKIVLEYGYGDRIWFPEIEVNTLVFDEKRLPKSLARDKIVKTIQSSKGEEEQTEEEQLRTSVMLDTGVDSLSRATKNFEEYLENLHYVPDLSQFQEKMATIKQALLDMKGIVSKYQEQLDQQYPGIQKAIDTRTGNIYYRRKK